MKNIEDTIAAIATAQGEAAIGIIRLSGNSAFNIVDSFFVSTKKRIHKPSRKLIHGILQDKNRILDEVLVNYRRGPKSYTGEDMVEIYAHGGTVVLSEILTLFLTNGARLAEPGEFTFRAFLNGKMDLAQAEAVIDVIQAKNKEALKIAQQQLQGKLSKEILSIKEILVEVLAHTEAAIDFSTEDIDVFSSEEMAQKIKKAETKTQIILNTYERGKQLQEGIRVAIIGRPNVGKSSLLNAFLNRERAIVTEEEGTTRDTIEEEFFYQGVGFRFIDTAGIREAHNKAEKIGIEHSFEKMKTADVVLIVIDGSSSLFPQDRVLLDMSFSQKKIVVLNKIDVPQNTYIEIEVKKFRYSTLRKVSALKKEGIKELLSAIHQEATAQHINSEDVLITKERHKMALENATRYLNDYLEGAKEKRALEFLALDLKSAVNELELILGRVTTEDVYDKIFSSFCIGK